MASTRFLSRTLVALLALALFAPSAFAAEGVGPAKALKEVLTISTVKPVAGATVSGTIGWEVV